MDWERVRVALVNGDLDRAQLQARSIEPRGTPDLAPIFIHPYEEINGAGIETIRLYIYQGKPNRHIDCLEVQLQHASATLRRRRLMKLHILRAMALADRHVSGCRTRAILAAVRLATPMRAVRCFVDEGPRCLALLKGLVGARTARLDGKITMHLQTLIDAFQPGRLPHAPPLALASKSLVETVSPRELQILERLRKATPPGGCPAIVPFRQYREMASAPDLRQARRQDRERSGVFLARQRGLLLSERARLGIRSRPRFCRLLARLRPERPSRTPPDLRLETRVTDSPRRHVRPMPLSTA
jgi:hypothetical protein